jgi:ABC-type multidrug transport system fused ATPase/permease subunit
LHASWEEVASRPEGELQELASGQAMVAASSVLHAAQALQAGLTFVMLIVATVVVGKGTAAASLVGAAVLAIVLRPIARAAAKRSRRRLRHDLDIAALTAESVRLAEEVAVFGVATTQDARGGEIIEQKRITGAAADFAAELTPVAYQAAVFITLFIGLGVLVVADVTVGPALGAIVVLLLRAFAYSQQAQSAYASAVAAIPRRDAVLEATRALTESRPVSGGADLEGIVTCELIGVGYAYPSGRQALIDIDLSIRRGEALGVTGPSGAGKSTLVQLLLRLRSPTSGRYLVNGRPATEYATECWTSQVSLVPQDPKLVHGTIADNIRFLRASITDDQVARAARQAGLDEALDRLVGPRDRALSGGQRQRLAIARALAGEPSLLVLDEPTSALDAECAAVIRETLESLKGKVTVVVIAHQPTTLGRCDRIVELRAGRIDALEEERSS